MVAIKGVEIPASCKCCIRRMTCSSYLNQYAEDPSSIYSYGQHERPDSCPLVELVTCKDCAIGQREKSRNCGKYCVHLGRITEDDWWCADAEKKE